MSETTPSSKSKAGSSTQDRLLEAAVDIFGEQGFKSATTRKIAREAGVNIAAIPYYYSGKEGLYRAAVSYAVEQIKTQVRAILEEIDHESSAGTASKMAALALLEKLLEKIINFMVGSPQAPRVARIILREQLHPSSAYEIIFDGFMAPVIDSIAILILTASEESSSRTAKLRAMAIMGQILAFRVGRETMVRALGLKGYSPEEITEIRQVILEQTRAAIKSLTRP